MCKLNRLGMMVNLSHTADFLTSDRALDLIVAPTIRSHSSMHGMWNHPRNMPDSILK